MWQNIRSAVDAFLTSDLALSNAILEAANIKTPNGSLDVCYDERGHQYNIPAFVYSDPIELVVDAASTESAAVEAAASTDGSMSNSASDPTLKKARAGNPINIKVRINPGDFSFVVECFSSDNIATFKKVVCEHTATTNGTIPVCDDTRQRVMFMGKELKNNQTLQQVGISDETKVVQVFMKPKR